MVQTHGRQGPTAGRADFSTCHTECTDGPPGGRPLPRNGNAAM